MHNEGAPVRGMGPLDTHMGMTVRLEFGHTHPDPGNGGIGDSITVTAAAEHECQWTSHGIILTASYRHHNPLILLAALLLLPNAIQLLRVT